MPKEIAPLSDNTIAHRNDVVNSLNPFVEKQLHLLLDPNTAWQPRDILPPEQKEEVKKEAKRIPPSLLVAFVGNTITEEGLPLFTSAIASFPFGRDITGTDQVPWLLWKRGWASEEHRHELVSHEYLDDVPEVNLKAVERDVQLYIQAGFGPGGKLADPYAANIYTSWQERATQESHKGVSEYARHVGAPILARVAGVMAGDEGRHSKFYIPVVDEIFKRDPEGTMISLLNVVDYDISMPGMTMPNSDSFVAASSAIGVYNLQKYLKIYKELIDAWGIESISVEGEAGRAQEKVLKKYEVLSRLGERQRNNFSGELASPWLNQSSRFIEEGTVELVIKSR